MGKDSAPTPPNPYATAGVQTATNVSTAVANAMLNNTNQVTPLGSLNYNQTDTFDFTDPTSGTTYQIPRFTAQQTLNPTETAIQNATEGTKYNLAGLSADRSRDLWGMLSAPLDTSAAPAAGQYNFTGQPQTSIAPTQGQQQYGFGDAGNINQGFNYDHNIINDFGYSGGITGGYDQGGDVTRSYGPADNFSADRGRVEDALYGRLNPQLQIEQQRLQQQLADQGIRYGSKAYTDAMDVYNRQANDARLAVTQTAGQEQQRMSEMARAQAGFQNTAQQQANDQAAKAAGFANAAEQQAYTQQQGRASFYNTAQGQQYDQLSKNAAFANAAQQQQYEQLYGRGQFANQAQQTEAAQHALQGSFYNQGTQQQQQNEAARVAAANQARNQYLQEVYQQRGQPINEISALMSGAQIQQPNFLTTPQNQIPTTDIAGLINQNFNQQFGNYQQQVSQQNALIGGAFGAAGNVGAAALKYSDERMKTKIHRIGTVFAAEPQPIEEPGESKSERQREHELPIYSYAYKGDPSSTQHIGPMAQDVEKIDPGAVHNIRGRKAIDTARVMGSILKAA